MGALIRGMYMIKAVHVIPEGVYENKRITAYIPAEYKMGIGFDLDRYLAEKNAQCLIYSTEGNMFKDCEFMQPIATDGVERLEIVDKE